MEFYKSLKGSDQVEGKEENNNEHGSDKGNDGDNEMVYYDEIDSSKTVDATVADIIKRTPADCLADIYADEDSGSSSESDAEGRGIGINLDMYTRDKPPAHNPTGGWMEWNSK